MHTINFQIFNFYCGKNNDQWKLAGEVDKLRRPFLKTTQNSAATTDQDSTTTDQGSRTAEEESTTEEEETAMNPDEYEKYILDELAGKKDYMTKSTSMLLTGLLCQHQADAIILN